jgi:GMP synthase-like glutamine amidotransferase
MHCHCLQHVSFETPGLLLDVLREKGYSLGITALYLGEELPPVKDFETLIIMGGPMSVHDEKLFPWLRAEKELIGDAIKNGKKVLGICLGAQLIAEVAGARVYPNKEKEIGFWPVQWIDRPGEDEVFFHWHGETFDLPAGAGLLASTQACTNQAFRMGDNVLGIQFHPEVTPQLIKDMVEQEGHELVEAPYIQTAEEIMRGAAGGDTGRGGAISFLKHWL